MYLLMVLVAFYALFNGLSCDDFYIFYEYFMYIFSRVICC